MKNDDFRRSVRTQRYDRSAGDAPGIGKVSRMPGAGRRKDAGSDKPLRDDGRGNRVRQGRRVVVITWTVLLTAVAMLVLGVAIWLGMSGKKKEQGTGSPAYVDLKEEDVRGNRSGPVMPTAGEATELVKKAIMVRDPQQVADHFQLGTATPDGVLEFLKSLETIDGKITKYSYLGDLFVNGINLSGVVVNFTADGKPRNRVAFLVADAEGRWLVDFDAFARTVSPSWKEILEAKPEVMVVRVYAAKDNYFNGAFADERQWTCYGIASPDTPELFLAYCRRGSAQQAAMDSVLSNNARLCRMTLEFRRVEGATDRQFEISQVLAQDWVVGGKPFDSKF